MIEIVTSHKSALQHLPLFSKFVHENIEVATAAIKAFPDNYKHVGSNVKEDTELALLFLQENPQYASDVPGYLFSQNKEFTFQASCIPGTPFCDVAYHFRHDADFMLALEKENKDWGYDKEIFENHLKKVKESSLKEPGFLAKLFKKSSSKKSKKAQNTKGMKM